MGRKHRVFFSFIISVEDFSKYDIQPRSTFKRLLDESIKKFCMENHLNKVE